MDVKGLNDLLSFEEYCHTLPYQVMPRQLYTPEMLYDRFLIEEPERSFAECFDTRVYQHVLRTGKVPFEPHEIGARAIHDAKLRQLLLAGYDPSQRHRLVGVMGGHQLSRSDAYYREVVEISKRLTEGGFVMISGGGPGAMEATHVGAWMAGRSDGEVDAVVDILAQAPTFDHPDWLLQAFKARERFPLCSDYVSLAVPTFFYGHEPPCAFATHIAKFFDNSQREDLILTAAFGGLIFMPGSAGTLQEVFQGIVQDHYLVYGESSPMVFVGRDFWTNEVPVIPFIDHMIARGRYKNLRVCVDDTTEEVLSRFGVFGD